jgi:hypothetical protein
MTLDRSIHFDLDGSKDRHHVMKRDRFEISSAGRGGNPASGLPRPALGIFARSRAFAPAILHCSIFFVYMALDTKSPRIRTRPLKNSKASLMDLFPIVPGFAFSR